MKALINCIVTDFEECGCMYNIALRSAKQMRGQSGGSPLRGNGVSIGFSHLEDCVSLPRASYIIASSALSGLVCNIPALYFPERNLDNLAFL